MKLIMKEKASNDHEDMLAKPTPRPHRWVSHFHELELVNSCKEHSLFDALAETGEGGNHRSPRITASLVLTGVTPAGIANIHWRLDSLGAFL